jgi:hypothetical protein
MFMNDMKQLLQDLRRQYSEELAAAETELKKYQAIINDRRSKIAAIDTLSDGRGHSFNNSTISFEDNIEEYAPVGAYWRPILSVLVELGGRGNRKRVIDLVGEKMQGVLTPADYRKLTKSNVTRWVNRVVWQASNMRKEGLIAHNSHRGIWEITDEGRRWLDDKNT